VQIKMQQQNAKSYTAQFAEARVLQCPEGNSTSPPAAQLCASFPQLLSSFTTSLATLQRTCHQ
jgi:hypothetical protein